MTGVLSHDLSLYIYVVVCMITLSGCTAVGSRTSCLPLGTVVWTRVLCLATCSPSCGCIPIESQGNLCDLIRCTCTAQVTTHHYIVQVTIRAYSFVHTLLVNVLVFQGKHRQRKLQQVVHTTSARGVFVAINRKETPCTNAGCRILLLVVVGVIILAVTHLKHSRPGSDTHWSRQQSTAEMFDTSDQILG